MKLLISKQMGFSLTELMVVFLIIAGTIVVGIPGFTQYLTESRLTSKNNEFVRTLNMARSESIKQGFVVAVCKSSQTPASCDDTRAWKNGWVVFVDEDNDQTIDVGETIIETFAGFDSGFTLSSTEFSDYILYRPDGMSNTSGEFSICSTGDHLGFRKIVISATGRIRSQDNSAKNYENEVYADVC